MNRYLTIKLPDNTTESLCGSCPMRTSLDMSVGRDPISPPVVIFVPWGAHFDDELARTVNPIGDTRRLAACIAVARPNP